MALNNVILTGTLPGAGGATATFVPSGWLTDGTDNLLIPPKPQAEVLSPAGAFSVSLLATDNGAPAPSGWTWTVTFSGISGVAPYSFSFFLAHATGATQDISGLAVVQPAASMAQYLPLTGGTLTGPLIINDVPSGAPSGLPVGYGDSETVNGLQIASSHPSDDILNGTDGTGRILLYSYQRANVYGFGETIRNFLMRWDSKANVAWYGPVDLYDGSGNAITAGGWKPWAWTGAHYESNSDSGIHGHWEVEVPDSTGALQGRLEVPFANTTTGVIGLDLTTINTNLANFHFFCHGLDHTGAYQEQFFRLTAQAGFEKALEWNNDGSPSATLPRWRMAATAAAESGSNVGTNWALYRFSDGGSNIGTPISIARSTGIVLMTDGGAQASFLGVGTAPSGTVPLLVSGGGSNVVAARFLTSASGGGGNTQPIVQAEGQDVLNRAFAAALASDTSMRWAVFTDGTTQWGTGSASRDAQLARTGTGALTVSNPVTPGSALLAVAGNLTVSGTTVLTGEVTVPNGSASTDAAAYGQLTAETARAEAAEVLLAPLASPALTGTPTVPTQTAGDNSTKAASTAFVTTAVAARVVSGQFLCTPTQYAPASQTALTVSTTTMAAFSSANVSTGSFTAPPSGSVLVTASFVADPNTGSAPAAIGLAAHGTVTPIIGNTPVTMDSTSGIGRAYTLPFLVTGLTPGNSYNFDLLGAVKSGDTFSILAFGQSTTTPVVTGSSGLGGPVLMTVQAI